MKTLVLGFATLSDAHWSLSGEVVLMTLLGGMGTFAGPVLGAFTIIGLQNFLADRVGSWVDGDHRRDLRRLRGRVPARLRRRTAGLAAAAQGGLTSLAGPRSRWKAINRRTGRPRCAFGGVTPRCRYAASVAMRPRGVRCR